MKACDAVKMQDNGRGNGRRTGRAAVGLVSRRLEGFWAAPVVLLTAIIVVSPAQEHKRQQRLTVISDASSLRSLRSRVMRRRRS